MKFTVILLVLGLACICYGIPANVNDQAVALRQKREIDILGNTRRLIEELLKNLQRSAQQALEAIATFTQGLQNQVTLFSEKLVNDVKGLRDRVTEAINRVTDRFTGTSAAVRVCIDSRKQEAEALFSETTMKSKSCADERFKEVHDMVLNLQTISNEAIEFSSSAMDDLKKCTDVNSGNMLATGACLGSVAVQTEMKGAIFLSQSGLLITRINLSIATLPAALEVCAGTQLLSAGIGTAKLVMEIARCSASSVVSSFTGNALES